MPSGKQAGTGDPTREGTTTDRAPERATTETAPRRRVSFFCHDIRATLPGSSAELPEEQSMSSSSCRVLTAARLGDGARPRID